MSINYETQFIKDKSLYSGKAERLIQWNYDKQAEIKDSEGNIVFSQKVDFPKKWSNNAINITSSKYFYGSENENNREKSLEELVNRVLGKMKEWSCKSNYFNSKTSESEFFEDLKYLIYNQYFSFNSPVWFNIGTPNKQIAAACYINKIDDNMESILDFVRKEGLIFAAGSGSGVNISPLREKDAYISGGGKSSGPLSFMKLFDRTGNTIKSGGKCLAPYQKVYTENGPIEVKDLIDRDFIVLSYHPPERKFKAKKACAWKSGKKEVYQIITDKGEFHLSYDHPILTADKRVIKTEDLKEGMSLFNCSINDNQNYIRVSLKDGKKGDDFLNELNSSNHRVKSIKSLGKMDVYSVEVKCKTNDDKTSNSGHNFVIWDINNDSYSGSGITVFNTRRAAKLVCMDENHPDIEDFIDCKVHEEKKAHALVDSGFDSRFDGDSYDTVAFQNANHSVRVSDYFMSNLNQEKNSQIMKKIALAAWKCGDPGLQFRDQIEKYNPLKNSGKINASNPCVPGWVTVIKKIKSSTKLEKIKNLKEGDEIWSKEGWTKVVKTWTNGIKDVWKYETSSGDMYATENHLIPTNENKIEIKDANELEFFNFNEKKNIYKLYSSDIMCGLLLGDGGLPGGGNYQKPCLYIGNNDNDYFSSEISKYILNEKTYKKTCYEIDNSELNFNIENFKTRTIPDEYFYSNDKLKICSLLRGLFSANGGVIKVKNGIRISFKSINKNLINQIHILLSYLGINSYHTTNKEKDNQFKNGIYRQKMSYDLCISRYLDIERFYLYIGFIQKYKNERINDFLQKKLKYNKTCNYNKKITNKSYYSTEEVFDITVDNNSHNFWCNGFNISNCSEYMSLDNTSCTLGSINLEKFLIYDYEKQKYQFDMEKYRKVISICTIALDILVRNCEYPIDEIAKENPKYRNIGLGFTNFGTVCMLLGYSYGDENSQNLVSVLSGYLTSEAYLTSLVIGNNNGSFPEFDKNKQSILEVMRLYVENVKNLENYLINYDDESSFLYHFMEIKKTFNTIIDRIKLYQCKLSNAEVTCLAPTGTISFMMDASTTGIEPELSLVKYKNLAGKGSIKIVNPTVKKCLKFTLGYDDDRVHDICEYIKKNGTIEGSKIKEEHLSIFDCSFKPIKGKRFVSWKNHIDILAAAQKFISMSISKTVNLDENITPEKIEEIYKYAWKRKCKCISIYRNNCKRSQPLSLVKEETKNEKSNDDVIIKNERNGRMKLPDTRKAINHKFTISGHEGYITVGLYENGNPGEIFITMSKEGSTISGLIDAFATAISISLQYGVPLKVLCNKLINSRYEPSGFTKNKNIRIAKSITDYIFRWLANKFLSKEECEEIGLSNSILVVNDQIEEKEKIENKSSDNICPDCGSIMMFNGSCLTCQNCGHSGGCS